MPRDEISDRRVRTTLPRAVTSTRDRGGTIRGTMCSLSTRLYGQDAHMYQVQEYRRPLVHDERLQVRSKPVPVQVPPRPRQTANPHRARRMLPHYHPFCLAFLYYQQLHSLATVSNRCVGERDNNDKQSIVFCV